MTYPPSTDPRPFSELRDSGLLWLINRTVFHPRGFALALVGYGGTAGWRLHGDGTEVWRFDGDEDALFEAAERTLTATRPAAGGSDEYQAGRRDGIRLALDATHVADDVDITDWQRGYRSCAERVAAIARAEQVTA